MFKIDQECFPFYQFESLAECPGIVHFVSSGAKTIGFSEEVGEDAIRFNRRTLALAVGFDENRLVMGHQVHSANVSVVTAREAGRGAMDKGSRLPDTDALVTAQVGICLMVLSADCVPILLYDPGCEVIAAVHAGWRGTAANIVRRTIEVMQSDFNCRVRDIRVGIGPSIGKCCFEVGEEVAGVFSGRFRDVVSDGRYVGKFQVDLWEANRLELLEAGVMGKNIEIAGMCTVCHPDHFFSYRRDGKTAGRFGAGILLKK